MRGTNVPSAATLWTTDSRNERSFQVDSPGGGCVEGAVYDLCRQAIAEDRPLIDLLAAHPDIAKHLDRPALERLCDPVSYLGQAGAMVDRVLARAS